MVCWCLVICPSRIAENLTEFEKLECITSSTGCGTILPIGPQIRRRSGVIERPPAGFRFCLPAECVMHRRWHVLILTLVRHFDLRFFVSARRPPGKCPLLVMQPLLQLSRRTLPPKSLCIENSSMSRRYEEILIQTSGHTDMEANSKCS